MLLDTLIIYKLLIWLKNEYFYYDHCYCYIYNNNSNNNIGNKVYFSVSVMEKENSRNEKSHHRINNM